MKTLLYSDHSNGLFLEKACRVGVAEEKMREKPMVMMVEDNRINRKILRKILTPEYEIIEAVDGLEAMALFQERYQELSAVILDLWLPGLNGEEFLRAVSQESRFNNIPILVATGEQDSRLERQCLHLGAWDYITKPYDAEILRMRLKNIIGRKESVLMERIQDLVKRDSLTNIYNRGYFMEETQRMLSKYPDETFVFLRMDIKQFSLYNASFGKAAGDTLLIEIGNSIARDAKSEPKTTYGRMESDVFCICTPYHEWPLKNNLKKAAEGFASFSQGYRMEIIFGACVIPEGLVEIEEIYTRATEAARYCKGRYDICYAFYGDALHQKRVKEQQILSDMVQAIEKKEFVVYLQPKYSLMHRTISGSEALVRWRHPRQGMISPGEFIPVFEKNGFIVRLDHYMWERVCQIIHRWLTKGYPVLPVSVNVSRISLYHPRIVEDLVALVEKYQIPIALLQLEITESAYMSNPEMMKSIIKQLRKRGFTILMDDFGSGYSSLNTLKDIDVDILKIDMAFLSRDIQNTKSEKILASITRMAGWLGMPVVVEGVETRERVEFLMSIGCGYVQGYYFARPMPVSDFEKTMNREGHQSGPSVTHTKTDVPELEMLWSTETEMGLLLRSIPVPYAILERAHGMVDTLRMNNAYLQVFGSDQTPLTVFGPVEYDKLSEAVEEALGADGEANCECSCVTEKGNVQYYHIHLKLIQKESENQIFGATFTDVTSERKIERELKTILKQAKGSEVPCNQMLIIDDSAVSQDILAELFEENYTIMTASNGQEAIDILSRDADSIAIILLDLIMPVMDGQTFLEAKNAMPQAAHIPVIIISSDSREDLQINMLASGVNDYITKPFVPSLTKRRVENVIEYNSRFQEMVREYRKTQDVKKLPQ